MAASSALLLSYSNFIAPVIGVPVSLGSSLSTAAVRSSWTLTTVAAIPAGVLVVVGLMVPSTSALTITGVSDGTNTYTQATTDVFEVGTQTTADIWYCLNALPVSSSATITATFSTSTNAQVSQMNAGYVTGIVNIGALDKVAHNLTNNGTAYSSTTTGTLTQANEMLFGFQGNYNANVTITEGSGYTPINTNSQGSGSFFMSRLAYQKVSATTAQNYQPSTSLATFGKCLLTTFKGY